MVSVIAFDVVSIAIEAREKEKRDYGKSSWN
jgi:hypothetical protein